MKIDKRVLIVGGDLRIVKLAELLVKDDFIVYTYALDKAESLKTYSQIKKCENLKETANDCEIIITSIPFSSNKQDINTPFSDIKLGIQEFFDNLSGKKIITGNVNEAIINMAKEKSIELIDLFEREELTILNTISTAEGAIQIAMEETLKTIHGSKVLVMGFGRVGKMLAKMFSGLGAKVYCEARKTTDLAWSKAYGYEGVSLKELDKYLGEFDVIVNTIPAVILDENRLKLVKQECVIIDLASLPRRSRQQCSKSFRDKSNMGIISPR